jgi:hypothetical protein
MIISAVLPEEFFVVLTKSPQDVTANTKKMRDVKLKKRFIITKYMELSIKVWQINQK